MSCHCTSGSESAFGFVWAQVSEHHQAVLPEGRWDPGDVRHHGRVLLRGGAELDEQHPGESGTWAPTLLVLLLPCSRPAPTVCLEVTFFSAPGSPIDLVKLKYQSTCLWWSVWDQGLCVEGNKASGSPLNQGGLFLWQNVVGPAKRVVCVCKQLMCSGYIS